MEREYAMYQDTSYLDFGDRLVLTTKRLLVIEGIVLFEFDSLNGAQMKALQKQSPKVHRHLLSLLRKEIRVRCFKHLTLERL